MRIDALREFFGWCIVINYGVLIVWFVLFAGARDWVHRLHEHWFRPTREQFDTVHCAGMGLFKLGIFFFDLAPYVALLVVRQARP